MLFLGLGSMWFHASIIDRAGTPTAPSMYVYAAFLVLYTLRRIVPADWVLWSGLSRWSRRQAAHAAWQWEFKWLILISSSWWRPIWGSRPGPACGRASPGRDR